MTGTEDLFTPIHKALRSMIYGLSSRLQTNDFADRDATAALVQDLENDFAVARSAGCTLCALGQHARDEESVIFPDVARHEERLVRALIEEHHELGRRELAIAKAGHELLALDSADDRVSAGIRLNQSANDLFALYIAHMNREESDLVPLMKERYSDPQMAQMRGKIIGAMPPDRMMAILGWMLPSLNVDELTGFVGMLKAGAQPPVFKAVADLSAARVDPARWKIVKERVGI